MYFKFTVELLKHCLYFRTLPSTHTPPPPLPPNKFIQMQFHCLSSSTKNMGRGGRILDRVTLRHLMGSLALSSAKSSISACMCICRCKFFKYQTNVTSLQLNSSCCLLRQNESNICKKYLPGIWRDYLWNISKLLLIIALNEILIVVIL